MYGYRQDTRNPFTGRHRALALRLALLVLLSCALMILDHRHQQLDRLHDVLSVVVTPVRWAVDAPARAVIWSRENLASRQHLIERNRRLREENLRTRGNLQRLDALQAENERLRELLQSARQVDQQVMISEILAVDMNPYRHQVVLNRGGLDEVYEGQALIDAYGVLGQVTHAGPLQSTALLITDPNHSIPVEINRNGLRTIAQGTGNTERLDLPYLPSNADVQPGDLLVSSALAGRFPRGFPVATVTEVEIIPGERFARVSARPTARIDRSREVLLVTRRPEPAAQDSPAADAAAGDSDKKPDEVQP